MGSSPQKKQFLGREKEFSSQTREAEKHAYYQNYCTDSNLLIIPTAATSMQPICTIMNFSTDWLERVGCCTSFIILLLTMFFA